MATPCAAPNAAFTGVCCALAVASLLLLRCSMVFEARALLRAEKFGNASDDDTFGGCKLVSTSYISSDLETAWLQNVKTWQHDYCMWAKKFTKLADQWLQDVKAARSGAPANLMNPAIFSRFEHTYRCRGSSKVAVRTTWIEPLSHGLRSPRALCTNRSQEEFLFDKDYVLLASASDLLLPSNMRPTCAGRRCANLLFDVGASLWASGPSADSQRFLVNTYNASGIDFDRILLWEAQIVPSNDIFQGVPREILHKYQYFAIPAVPDGPGSPIAVLQQIARPGDFVVFKLDIDATPVELPITEAILRSEALQALVSEFIFEFHVNFTDMHFAWKTADEPRDLADAYDLFFKLRSKGIRAHSWV